MKAIEIVSLLSLASSLVAQPSVRDLNLFPQHVVTVPGWGEGFSVPDGDPIEIVVGARASEASLSAADSALALIRDSFRHDPVRIVTLGSESEAASMIILSLDGEMNDWDEYRQYLSFRMGDMTLGTEGYLFAISDNTILFQGGGSRGLQYGWQTMKSLLYRDQNGTVRAQQVLIRDYPEFPDRILRTSSNFQVAANIPPMIDLARRAWNLRFNKIAVNDVKFNRLDQVPDWYFDNVETFRIELARLNLEPVPGVADFGYSEGMLWDNPNLAEGVPVRNARFVVEDGIGRHIPDAGMTLSNGGFEDVQNNRFAGFTSQENAGVSVFDDQQIVHSGNHSVRMENFRQGNNAGNCRFQMLLSCQPFRNYYFSIWVRTRNFQADWGVQAIPYQWIDGNLGRPLAFPDFGVGANNDWRKLEISFNSLDNRQIRLYFGVWGASGGQIWFDDAELREVALVNLLRRDGCPLTITSADGETVYEEEQDYERLVDRLTGNIQWPGDFNLYHEPPDLQVIEGRIENGDTLLASFYHPILVYYGQVMCCPSEDETYRWLEEDASRIADLWEPESFFMNYDEIRVLNWDDACQSRGITPAEILSSSVARCRQIYNRAVDNCGLYVWSDMFDPFHNAVESYYLVSGSLVGAGEALHEDIAVVVWRNAENSFRYFAGQGHDVLGSADCSNSPNQAETMSNFLRLIPEEHRRGLMFTTWNGRYDHLEAAAPSFWSHYPHIIAKYPEEYSGRIEFTRLWPPHYWDNPNFPHVDSVFYRLPGDESFRGVQALSSRDNETCFASLDIGDAIGYRYYILSYGPGGGNTSPPGAPANSYLVGVDWQDVSEDEPGHPNEFRLVGIYPNPFNSEAAMLFELPEAGRVKLSITEINGRELSLDLMHGAPGSNRFTIDGKKLGSGVYFARIEWMGRLSSQKFTVLK